MATLKSGLNSGSGFSNSDTITSTTLNNHVNDGGIVAGTIATADMANSTSKTTGVTFEKMQHISDGKVLGNVSGSEGDVAEVDFKDEDTMTSNSATAVASQQSIKAYVDNSALKETILVYNSSTIDIPDKDTSANGVQVPLGFEHLRDSAESDPDTAGTDINDAGISLSSNEFTLTEGTYDIEVKSVVSLTTTSSGGPGLQVAGFVKRKSDDVKILISNVVEASDDISSRTTAHCFVKGRIVIPSTPSTNTNVFDLRFYKDNSGTAVLGSTYASGFIGDPNPPQVFVSIKKVKA